MKFTIATIAAAAAALVSAAPHDARSSTIAVGDVFTLQAIRSGSKFQNLPIQASHGGLMIGGKQDAQCDNAKDVNYATFYLTADGILRLNTRSNPTQQIYFDRSGMGQGVIRINEGVEPLSGRLQNGPFVVENGSLLLKNGNAVERVGFQACPTTGGAYSVWFAGVTEPAGIKGCLPFTAKVQKVTPGVKCTYTLS